jgi:Cd2+/Zn2+-exporting ATPase
LETRTLELPYIFAEYEGCDLCLARLRSAIKRLKGVKSLAVRERDEILHLTYDPDLVSLEQLQGMARDAGMRIIREIRHLTLKLEGLDCPDCAKKIEKSVSLLDGVLFATVNFSASLMKVEYEVSRVSPRMIRRLIYAAGYQLEGDRENRALRLRRVLTIASAVLIFAAFGAEKIALSGQLVRITYLAATLCGGWYVFRGAVASLRMLTTDMNVLMTVAVVGAVAIGELWEAAAVVLLYSIGEFIQDLALERNRRALRRLVELRPGRALKIVEGGEVAVDVDKLAPGDLILVKPGEKFPVDGLVHEGRSSVNESSLTGESIPVDKGPGSNVSAGSLNGKGSLTVSVARAVRDDSLTRLRFLIEEAVAQRAPTQMRVESFARWYTPTVVALAILIACIPPLVTRQPFGAWLYRALVLLVISCPCALVLSTPVAIVSAIASASRRGVLFKGGIYLEALRGIKAIAVDKTGTLTTGTFKVTDIVPLSGSSPDEALALAACLESRSEHPLAEVVVKEARKRGHDLHTVEEFESLPGRGARGVIDGIQYFIGSPELCEERGCMTESAKEQISRLCSEGKTVSILFAQPPLALIAMRDDLRREARPMIAALLNLGVERVVLLTGDHGQTASAIAAEAGIKEFYSGLRPEDKLARLEAIRKESGSVAMVGDGINDAPSLAAADVGIAIGVAGNDTAIEAADMALMTTDLTRVPDMLHLSRRTSAVISQNIIFSIAFKGFFMLLTLLGMATLWMGVIADTGTAVLVALNGMRLLHQGRRIQEGV